MDGVKLFPILLFIVIIFKFARCNSELCSRKLQVNISDGEQRNGKIYKHNTEFDDINIFKRNNSIFGCICNLKTCVTKCCSLYHVVNEELECVPHKNSLKTFDFHELEEIIESNVNLSHKIDKYHLVLNSNYCGKGKTPLLDLQVPVFLQKNGSLYVPEYDNAIFPVEDYCIDKSDNRIVAMVCISNEELAKEEEKHSSPYINKIGMIISMPFLLTTFLVYALLPDRNLHAKALMFYTLSLFFGYLILVIIQLSKADFPRALCQTLGFSVQFFFILSFFWMNVICADIWFTFSGYRRFSVGKRSAETKRFILYCLYACGMSFLITFITLLINTYADDSSDSAFRNFHPNIGNGQCFLRGTWPELLYFYGPMGLILATNMIFFAITAFKIRQAKKDTSVLKKGDSKRHSYENDKQNFKLYLRLLLAMGINWTMELISWAVQAGVSEVPNYVWYVTDFCNAIYGVFIFFLFVFKKKIWKLLKKRYYTFIGKPQLGHFTSDTTNQTRTSNYSTAETSLTDNHHHSIHREEIPLRTST